MLIKSAVLTLNSLILYGCAIFVGLLLQFNTIFRKGCFLSKCFVESLVLQYFDGTPAGEHSIPSSLLCY